RSTDAGEIWHLLDQRYDMRVTKVEMTALGRVDLNKYTAVIMPGGNYGSISGGDRLKEWVQQGGVIVAYQEAVQWLRSNGLAFVEFRQEKASDATPARRPYTKREEDRGALQTSGAIFENLLDNGHPIGYGYTRDKMPVFRSGNLYFEPAKNPYATPLLYSSNPLMSGYLHTRYAERVRGSAGAVVSAVGRGKVVAFADNTQFRAFWFGANKLLANAIFFGHTIHPDASERSLPKE
ncbi:MAG TPA: zinc carboxypeptidase, partial [Saprospiraceae bacterium]|nr:zinc carboxypeptidase [Saprospiraceae bacterium]